MVEGKPIGERMMVPWWKMPVAGVMLEPGASVEYRTGDWRTLKRAVVNQTKCIGCMICWIFCPDGSIVRTGDKVDVDYEHCKGCGICAVECPVDAISMEDEA
jgi:pyruvate ferredoxin oxidoreductase delta subunit